MDIENKMKNMQFYLLYWLNMLQRLLGEEQWVILYLSFVWLQWQTEQTCVLGCFPFKTECTDPI